MKILVVENIVRLRVYIIANSSGRMRFVLAVVKNRSDILHLAELYMYMYMYTYIYNQDLQSEIFQLQSAAWAVEYLLNEGTCSAPHKSGKVMIEKI